MSGGRKPKLGQGLSRRGEGELRVIGGSHRSRRVTFPPEAGVRPTPDRVRQTVFDWLSPWISGARVLDLFAGSGALGFEAVSRGAARARLLENQPVAAKTLWQNVRALGFEDRVTVEQTDTRRVDLMSGGPWDVVFLDPPYEAALWRPLLERLAEPGVLAPRARVYAEHPASLEAPAPDGWAWDRYRKAGKIRFGLLVQVEPGAAPAVETRDADDAPEDALEDEDLDADLDASLDADRDPDDRA